MDKPGKIPEKVKRDVLSQDSIWAMLERNRELIWRIGISEIQEHDNDGHPNA